ncbi:alpha-2,8-polysialyltransferase family protein [Enterobacter wuhouensis]|uniref:alpha-2,8-polysialyltransferase family protein n=1 Tax=Enterobacter wuhouensis TaxID=2529381 RepID=UPI0021E5CB53|nr:alpha-2,8-polysialyltransferase family protein [Enterobacter wuhouensis]MCV2533351.1 alpha-2,8-polysialyltransferase family protein [Enterobacter wuhouensis]
MADLIFISGVLNESHLVYVSSYIHKLKTEHAVDFKLCYENNKRFLSSSKIDPAVIEKWLGKVEFVEQGEIVRADSHKKIIHIFIGSVGIKPAILMRLHNFTSSISNVVIDEGIGSVNGVDAMAKVYMRERSPNVMKAYLYACIYKFVKRGFLANKIWKLFYSQEPNKHIIDFIKDHCEPKEMATSGYFLLLTQPWVKLGVLNKKEYEDFLTQLMNVLNALGAELIVKAHPSEDLQFYKNMGVKVFDTLTPVELCFDYRNCRAVLGFNSTSLILLNIIYQVPTFRLRFDKLDTKVSCSAMQESLFEKYSSPRMSLTEILNVL